MRFNNSMLIFRSVLIILLFVPLIQGCVSIFGSITDDINKDIMERSESDKTRQHQDKAISSVYYDDLHLYIEIRKQVVFAQLYSGITLIKTREYNIPFHRSDGTATTITVEDYLVMRKRTNDQVELGHISFYDNKLSRAERNLKTYEISEAHKAIDYFGEMVQKIRHEAGPAVSIQISRSCGNGISIVFIAKDKSFSKEIALCHIEDKEGKFIAVREMLYSGYRAN